MCFVEARTLPEPGKTAEIGPGAEFREDFGNDVSGHSPRGEGCQCFVVCQVRFCYQLQGRDATQINFIVFELELK
jgi:hypothetical protein